MEYLRVYDNNKKPLDKKVLRGIPLKENEHILISLIFIENEKGNISFKKLVKTNQVSMPLLEVM